MSLILTLTIILPLIGAGVTLGLSLVPRARSYTYHITLTAVGLTVVLLLMLRWIAPIEAVLSLWQPSLLFGSALKLQTDVAMQPLAWVLSLVFFCAVLVELARGDAPRPQLASALQVLLSASFVALWSANVLTMVVSWAIYDLFKAVAYITAGGAVQRAIRGMIFGNLATLILWSGMFLSGGEMDSELWSLMTLSGAQLTVWSLAGMLRLWVYPFHLSVPDHLVTASPLATPLLLGPIVGWGLWLRIIAANGGAFPGDVWIPILAAGTQAVGGLLAWSCESPRRLLPWIGMGANGALLLAAGLAREGTVAIIVAGGVAWALGIAVFFLGDGWQRVPQSWFQSLSWNVPTLVGLLTLLGAPLTLGFVTAATLLGELIHGSRIEWGVTFWGTALGYLLLAPSLVRRLLVTSSASLPDRREMIVARGIGLGLPMLLLIVSGLYPPLLINYDGVPSFGVLLAKPGIVGWLLWGIALACGGVLAWQEGFLRPRIGPLLSAVHDVLRLEWLYSAVVGALDRGLSMFQVADEVVGGAGALLWSMLLFLLFVLVRSGL
jgi:formate hydrogenlyase subunit 3/multisubunit Na+/H+ antiporter MnhD subunit